MKKKIGTLKGHPIVDGDINLVRYPEIHVKKLCEEVPKRVFKIKLEWNEELEGYTGSAIFPVNVIPPNDERTLVGMVPQIKLDALTEPQFIRFKLVEGVLPANVGVIIISDKEEISFTQTTKKLSLSYPFLGFSVHSDFYLDEICETNYLMIPLIYVGSSNTFSEITEDSILPKNIPIWIDRRDSGTPAALQKLNYIFKDKLNYISKKIKKK